MSSKARIVVASVIFIGILFCAVYPTRTFLSQQRELRAVRQKLDLFKKQNGRLEAEAKRLESDEEIERIARARFNLVKPGEEAYAIVPVPPSAPPAAVPGALAPAAPGTSPAPAATAGTPIGQGAGVGHAVLDWMVGALQRVF